MRLSIRVYHLNFASETKMEKAIYQKTNIMRFVCGNISNQTE